MSAVWVYREDECNVVYRQEECNVGLSSGGVQSGFIVGMNRENKACLFVFIVYALIEDECVSI